MSTSKKYTITAALPYTNGPVHIGHLAGVYVPADIYARFLRMTGNEVAFVCGSDEHGVPITLSAKKEGVSPQEIVDKYHGIIKNAFTDFGITFDNYSRTSATIHHETAADFFMDLYENGVFEEQVSEQYYDAAENQFLADRYLTGECPKCGTEDIYRDQCESCGATNASPQDLKNVRSTITGNIPVLKETKHWFLPFDEDFLKEWILEGHKDDWKTNVLGQVKSWIDAGLRPRAVTRDLDWGIKVPIKGADGKVLYVWFDAPIGYISATKEWAEREGKNWEDFWKNDQSELVHFIGKDNIVFHCLIFPQMLKSHSENYTLPTNVPANEFLNLEGNKISTSKNWAVWLHEYLEEFPNMQDSLRYALTANAPETKDNDFTWKDFQARNNNELASILGNFVNRVIVLTNKYYDGVVPSANEFSDYDAQTLEEVQLFPAAIERSMKRYRFREASQEMMQVARLGNKYLTEEEPWKKIKEDPARVQTVMYVALQITAAISVLAEPFLPFTSEKLKNMLQLEGLTWNTIEENQEYIKAGHKIAEKSEILFPKVEDKTVQAQLDKLEAIKKANEAANKTVAPVKETISFEDFTKMDMRVGTILEAEKIKKTKKLLQLKVDVGTDVRTIVSGIAESFTPEEVVGQKVVVLVNLAPRKMRGVESQGMILMADKPDGTLAFVQPDQKEVQNGEPIS